jgi:hypothetical protein
VRGGGGGGRRRGGARAGAGVGGDTDRHVTRPGRQRPATGPAGALPRPRRTGGHGRDAIGVRRGP